MVSAPAEPSAASTASRSEQSLAPQPSGAGSSNRVGENEAAAAVGTKSGTTAATMRSTNPTAIAYFRSATKTLTTAPPRSPKWPWDVHACKDRLKIVLNLSPTPLIGTRDGANFEPTRPDSADQDFEPCAPAIISHDYSAKIEQREFIESPGDDSITPVDRRQGRCTLGAS